MEWITVSLLYMKAFHLNQAFFTWHKVISELKVLELHLSVTILVKSISVT